MPVRLHALDLGVVGLYLVAITLFGLRFSRHRATGGAATGAVARDRSLRGYFLANRTVPWWAIALSIVSAETSTLTIIGTPGLAFAGDFGFLQIVIGYMLGRVVVALLFLPKYFQGEMLTAYQLIDRRFGHTLHKVTAGLFLLTRAAAEGVRVFAVSIVVGIAIGTGDVLSIAIISALTLLYTFEGGMAAVIWTDVVQMAIYVGGTLVAIWSLGAHVPGGWATIHAVGAAAGKFHMLNFALNLTTTYTFWAGVLGGTFLTMASHGTDQLMVQRMLAAKNLTESRLALLSSGVVIFIQFALFLLIGAGLFVFYGMHPGAPVSLLRPGRATPTASFPPSSCSRCRSASRACWSPPSSPPRCPTSAPRSTRSRPPRWSTSTWDGVPAPTTASEWSSPAPAPCCGRWCSSPSPSTPCTPAARATSSRSASPSPRWPTAACSESSCSAPSRATLLREERLWAW